MRRAMQRFCRGECRTQHGKALAFSCMLHSRRVQRHVRTVQAALFCRTVHAASGKYGVELLYDLMHAIYTRAKAIKPDALINASPCHPYFADVCDHGRLHDYDYKNRNNRADMTMRARLYQAALPGLLLDTDNAGFAAKRDTMHWLLAQSHVGVPDLYALRGGPHCDLNADDLAAVAENWAIYSRRIDAELREMD